MVSTPKEVINVLNLGSNILGDSSTHPAKAEPPVLTLPLATTVLLIQSIPASSTQPSSSHQSDHVEERNSPKSLLKAKCMLEEACHVLSFTPRSHGMTFQRKMIIENVKSKLTRLLDCFGGGFSMISNNQVYFDQLRSLLDELKIKLQEFSKNFVNKVESY